MTSAFYARDLHRRDVHTALLVSFAGMAPAVVKSAVTNQQVAPTLVRALGLDPNNLQAVQREQIDVLPFLFAGDVGTIVPSF